MPTTDSQHARWKILGQVLRFALIGACLIYVVYGLDWPDLGAALMSYDLAWVSIAALLTVSGFLLLGIRLALISKGLVKVGWATRASLVGLAINSLLPAKAGEIAKVLYLSRHTGAPSAPLLSLVFWERFADINLILLLACFAVFAVELPIALGPLIAFVITVWGVVLVSRFMPGLMRAFSRRIPVAAWSDFFSSFYSQIQSGLAPATMLRLATSTTILWIHSAMQALVLFLIAAKLPITVYQALIVFLLAALSAMIPASPGGIGILQAAIVFGLGLFGVNKSDALAAGLVLHMIYLVPAIVGGMTLLMLSDKPERSLLIAPRRLAEQVGGGSGADQERERHEFG